MKLTTLLFCLISTLSFAQNKEQILYAKDGQLIGWDMTHFNSKVGNADYILSIYKSSSKKGLAVSKRLPSNSIQWTKLIAGDFNNKPMICSDYFGNAYAFAIQSSRAYVFKLNSSGVLQWSKQIGWSSTDIIEHIDYQSGKIVLSGTTTSLGNGSINPFVIVLDVNGSLQMSSVLQRASDDVNCKAIIVDGAIYLAGNTTTNSYGKDDLFLAKLDSTGQLIWYQHYGTSNGEGLHSIVALNGNIYTSGVSTASNGSKSATALKFDSDGKLLKAVKLGNSDNENFNSVSVWNDHLVLSGRTDYNGKNAQLLVLLDENLTVTRSTFFTANDGFLLTRSKSVDKGQYLDFTTNCSSHSTYNATVIYSIKPGGSFSCNEKEIKLQSSAFNLSNKKEKVGVLTTAAIINKGDFEVSDLKIDQFDPCKELSTLSRTEPEFSIYPNPSSGVFMINSSNPATNIRVFNQMGQKLYENTAAMNESQIELSFLPNGIYLLVLDLDGISSSQKIIIRK